MVRNYKRLVGARTYRDYSTDNVQRAVDAYRNGQGSFTYIAESFGIPVATLYRKVRNLHTKPHGGQTKLSAVDETALVKCIAVASDWGFPFEADDVRRLAKDYLNRRGVQITAFENNMPGRDWYSKFMARHKDQLSQRNTQAIKESRAKVDAESINRYFDNLTIALENVPPEAIVNYDETNFTDDPGRVKVLVRRSSKRAEKVMDTSKAATSVMFSCAGSGEMLPVYVVYKAEHLWQNWTENGPHRARYNRSASGWFDTALFEEWFCTLALPYFKSLPDTPKLLIGDNLASHISVRVISLCEENNIRFVLLPPNSTHMTQPLDVCVFRPVKNAWRKILRVWKKSNKGVVRKDVFPRLLNQAMQSIESTNAANVTSGFAATGICPLDRDKILSKLPKLPAENAVNDACHIMTKMFKEARYGKEGPTPKGRRKKLNVEAGKSVSQEDLLPVDSSEPKPAQKKKKAQPKRGKSRYSISESDTDVELEKGLTDSETEQDMGDLACGPEYMDNDQNELDAEPSTSTNHYETDDGSDITPDVTKDYEAMEVPEEKDYKVNDFVLVELTSTKHNSKRFVAKIQSIEDGSYFCSYMRPHSKIVDAFVFPWAKEESLVDKEEIKKKLNPQELRRGAIKFPGIQLTPASAH